jgi:hypothetical protein
MNDKELADKVVALGAGSECKGFYSHVGSGFLPEKIQRTPAWFDRNNCLPAVFVRDWRVAGALMEKCQKVYVEYIGEPEQTVYARAENNRTWEWPAGENLPRTIIAACVEALDD